MIGFKKKKYLKTLRGTKIVIINVPKKFFLKKEDFFTFLEFATNCNILTVLTLPKPYFLKKIIQIKTSRSSFRENLATLENLFK